MRKKFRQSRSEIIDLDEVPPKMNLSSDLVLGIEGGATHTTVLWVDANDAVLREFSLGPSNALLLTDAELGDLFREVKLRIGGENPAAICVGLAGVRGEKEALRVRAALDQCWPTSPARVTDDLETALAAGVVDESAAARVLILSGTGSCCFGRAKDGSEAKVGGRGHVLGDRGSSCDIGLQGLRAAVAAFDHTGEWPRVGEAILAALQINDLESLIPWSIEAGKLEIASLAVPVFSAAKDGCSIASQIVNEAAERLANDAVACAEKLAETSRVQFLLAGGTLRKQPDFARKVAAHIGNCLEESSCDMLDRAGTWGAVALARELIENGGGTPKSATAVLSTPAVNLQASPTEQRNPRSLELDQLSIGEAVELMANEDRLLPDAILAEKENLVWLVEQVVDSFRSEGRLFYVGAGTSGRLGVLDASECPPTFQSPAEQVQGIIAGGYRALWSPIEGAEDDRAAGARAIQFRGVDDKDTVLGIAASGRTPFVHGSLCEAKRRGAKTALLCFNPSLEIPDGERPDRILCPEIGPEILTGSTRLKSGTATKMVLNIVTTLAMVQTGKVISNLMVDVNASNEKLRDRAVRITIELTGAAKENAADALRKSGWSIREACRILGKRGSGMT